MLMKKVEEIKIKECKDEMIRRGRRRRKRRGRE